MPGNVLQSIGLTPDWFKSVMGGVIDPNAAQAEAPQPAPDNSPALPPAPSMDTGSPDAAPAAPPQNLLQGLSGYSAPDVGPVNALQGVDNAPQAEAPAAAPRERHSLLDTIGRLADVFARVGGAEPLYQPTLDAREAHGIALSDHARAVDLDKLKLASGQMDNDTQGAKMTSQAMRGLQAIMTANPQADPATIWPLLAKQAGIPADRAAVLGHAITTNPELIQGIIDTGTDPKDDKTKFGFQPIYTTDAQGKLHVHQLSSDGSNQIPQGETPIDPLKFVDTGGSVVGMGTRTGVQGPTLTKTEKPGAVADRKSREDIAANHDATTIHVAGMPARGKPGAGDGGKPEASNAMTLLSNIENGFSDLHKINALPGDDGGTLSNVAGAIGRTGVGQAIGEQAGTPSAQKRLEIMKNVSALQQAMLKDLPASATRTKFEQEMLARGLPDPSKMSYATARTVIGQLRESYLRAKAVTSQPAPSQRRALPPRLGAPAGKGAGKPTVSNW